MQGFMPINCYYYSLTIIKFIKKLMITKTLKKILILAFFSIFLTSCSKDFFKYSPAKNNPIKGTDRAKKNVEEGRGVSLGGLRGKRSTTYEFSTSNPLWRASLDVLDFIPMATVDYSGGTIISDWYTDGSQNNESIKISVRFLSNEVRSNSLKVMVHKKQCQTNQNCKIRQMTNSIIVQELHSSILRKAAEIEIEQKKNKKKK